jgi:hypothetical protein
MYHQVIFDYSRFVRLVVSRQPTILPLKNQQYFFFLHQMNSNHQSVNIIFSNNKSTQAPSQPNKSSINLCLDVCYPTKLIYYLLHKLLCDMDHNLLPNNSLDFSRF